MRFGILGTVQVWDDQGTPVSVGGPRVRALLALLLLNAGKVVSPELLIDGLYGDEPPAGAGNALQSQVSRLRRVLKGIAEVESSAGGYRLAVDPQAVDAHRFRRLVADASGLGAAEKAALLEEALRLWRGPALADVPEARDQAVRFEEARATAVEDRAAARLELGEHRELVAPLRELAEAHPLRERPRALLMRALYGSGRQDEALELYERTRRMLADELGTDPSAELSDVHLAILRGEPEPASGPEPVKARVPAQFTSFVGRADDLARIGSLLDDARLVTLIEPGGAGKTRLAIEAGARSGGTFADFAAVSAGEGQNTLARVVMGALGLREAGVLPSGERLGPVERLETALGDRPTLLIFDNCEHVIGPEGEMIHVKPADRSAPLSHQFMQALVSTEALHLRAEARTSFAELVASVSGGTRTVPPDTVPKKIIFAIMLKTGKALASTCETLRRYGVDVEVIAVPQA
ncbi:TIGR04141 family sporadically distributed protein [Actinocorallia sp. B10E7]|uniref:AfsR/SARP family transcriptional regulator n=1 Tax=Actinocorallia sp. B10E7 TaxID=3153558 RepID=UPI00325C3F1C